MARYFIYLGYDGTNYHGWQIQPNGASVQEELQKALSTLMRRPMEVVGAGRTDAGVHASLMIAHTDIDASVDASILVDKLNRLLPPDIAVYRIRRVTDEAHARFDATYRKYQYHITTSKNPFLRHYAWRVFQPLDFERMNEAAAVLFEYTDFTSFSKLHTDVKTNNCRIMQSCTPVGSRRVRTNGYLLSKPTGSCATWCGRWSVRSSKWDEASFR